MLIFIPFIDVAIDIFYDSDRTGFLWQKAQLVTFL